MKELTVDQCESVTGGVWKQIINCILPGGACSPFSGGGTPSSAPAGEVPSINLGDLGAP